MSIGREPRELYNDSPEHAQRKTRDFHPRVTFRALNG